MQGDRGDAVAAGIGHGADGRPDAGDFYPSEARHFPFIEGIHVRHFVPDSKGKTADPAFLGTKYQQIIEINLCVGRDRNVAEFSELWAGATVLFLGATCFRILFRRRAGAYRLAKRREIGGHAGAKRQD